jgi:ABC-type multidrug transport system fused ATPase/permease subunit
LIGRAGVPPGLAGLYDPHREHRKRMSDKILAFSHARRGGAAGRRRAPAPPEARAVLWRMIRLVYPHRRTMILGVVLGMGVALTYAASLGGMLPVLKVVVENESVHDWLLARSADGAHWYSPLLARAAGFFPAGDAPDARMRSLMILLGVLVSVNLLGNSCRCLSQYLVLYSSHRVVMDLRRRMYRKALHVPMTELGGELSTRVSHFLADVREVMLGIGTLFGKFAREPFKAVCVLAVALLLDARLTLVVLAIAPIAVSVLWYFGRKVRKATQRLLRGYGMMLGNLEETLQGIDMVKGYAREGHERKRMWKLERWMLKQQLRLAWIEAFTSPLMEVVGVLAASGAIVWLAGQTFANNMEPSHFITMVILMAAMLDPVRKIANVYNVVQRSTAGAARIFDYLDQPEERSPANAKRLPVGRAREVCFANVTFRYSPEAEPAVREATLTVAPGECVAIVGPNGSGKTTLMRLLPRLIEPQEGRLTIDGLDVGSLGLKGLREQIAVVSQRPVIFARSVRDNIAYGNQRADLEQVRAAARRAYAAEFIEQWPEQYDTVLEEFGANLSGGQRQRIAIARAFLKPSTILVFDEATSEIDADSERKIHAALEELREGKTTFLIAHRHTVMDLAERVIVMDAGRIVDAGTHAELLERCPLYVALYRSPVPA